MMSGAGKLIIKKKDKILYQYEGNFAENKKDGQGEITYQNEGRMDDAEQIRTKWAEASA